MEASHAPTPHIGPGCQGGPERPPGPAPGYTGIRDRFQGSQDHPRILKALLTAGQEKPPPSLPPQVSPTPFQPVLPLLQDLMTQNGISYVLNASNSCPKPDFICESRFMRVPINDNYCEKLLPWLDKSIEFIGESAAGGGRGPG